MAFSRPLHCARNCNLMSGRAEALGAISVEHRELRRTLSYRDLVIYGLAYVCPFAPLQTLGFVWSVSNGLIALAYILGAVCMYFTAKSYAVMTEAVPTAGSVYGFARHSLGPFTGFVAGWMLLLDYLLIPAYVYVFMSVAMTALVPEIDRAVWIVLLSAVTLGINWFGVTVTARVNVLSVGVQLALLAALMVFSVLALRAGKGTGGLTLRPIFAPELLHAHAIFSATSICVMSFLGFDAISTLAEEVKGGDKRLVGRAIVMVLVLSAALFALVAWVLGNLMQGFVFKDLAAAVYELAGWSIGAWAAIGLAWAMATVAGFTNALPMQVGVARVLFAMGRDRQLPHALSRLHPKYGTPYIGMLVTAAISLSVALAMRFKMDELVSLVNFGALTAFLLLHVSVIVLFWMRARSGRWIAHLLVPLAGIGVVLVVLSGMSSLAMILGFVWLVVGLSYGLVLRRRHRDSLSM
jgi:amino acid transporter